jgi:hypothetical protein
MIKTVRVVRVVGIAIGSLVAAYLAFSLIAGILLGWTGKDSLLAALVVVALGGLVFADIMRRERRDAPASDAPSA